MFCYGSDIENTRENLWFYAHLLLDSRSKQSWVGWAIIFILLHPIVLCSRNFLHQLLALSHATPSCDNPVDYNQRKVIFLFCSKLISTCLCSFSSSALPLLAMDLCWTSTSASAGEDFTIRAEWRSMALKVGYKALCNNNKKMHIAVSCQIKTLSLAKASFWELWKKEENNHLFWADSHTFCLKFLLQLWRGILGFVRLWNLKLQSREFDCSYVEMSTTFLFWAPVGATGGIRITDLLDCVTAA